MPNTENQYMGTDLGNVSPNPRGEYSVSENYEYLDTVSYEGGSYLCRAEFGTTVSGKAPVAGENTDIWQMLTLPGGLTPEYVAMYDNVASKAIQVESSRAVVEQAQQEVEAAQADVQQLHSDTVAASQAAEESRDSAAGYAQASEASRTAAEEAESNVNALVNGFDEHVTQQITKAEEDITKARQQAVSAVESQQATSIQYVQDQTAAYTEAKKKEISDTTEAVKKTVEEAGTNQIKAIADSLDKNLDTEGKAADAGATGKAIGSLKSTLENANKNIEELADKKITKFYASNQGETHLADSDNGKIMDMMVYGRSEQKQYNGYQLFIPKNKTFTSEGVTVTYSEDGIITLNGTATGNVGVIGYLDIQPDTKLRGNTELLNDPNVNFWIYTMADSYKTIYVKNFGDYFTVDSDITPKRVAVSIGNSTGIVFENTKIRLTIAEGTERKSWEPYTGGISSPNPDYPQEIKGVVNPTVKVHGKNIVRNYIVNEKKLERYYKALDIDADLEPDTIYTISFVGVEGNEYYTNERLFTSVIAVKCTGKRQSVTVKTLSSFDNSTIFKNNRDQTNPNIFENLMIEKGSTATEYEPYKEQLITLPYTLNAIPVNSGGNITIDGQQYIADYVDVEKGKLVQRIDTVQLTDIKLGTIENSEDIYILKKGETGIFTGKASTEICNIRCTHFGNNGETWVSKVNRISWSGGTSQQIRVKADKSTEELLTLLNSGDVYIDYVLAEPVETDLTPEEIQAFKSLATYYSATNISVTSDQLDGYTVFNYPISMENGWNYVKQQLGDTRDYIYDMAARTQDIDTQSAEAYVNSEYAVALTELEV